jgi:predicted alpha-1,2-mannosidase
MIALRPFVCPLLLALLALPLSAAQLWEIGRADGSAAEFALAPKGYARFLEADFGWEDRYYLIGASDPARDWPYVLPGPRDQWGGTSHSAGARTHFFTILFGLDAAPSTGDWRLVIGTLDNHPTFPPLLKVSLNGKPWTFQLPPGGGTAVTGDLSKAVKQTVTVPLPPALLRRGGNELQLTTLAGSWLVFDQVRLEAPEGARLIQPGDVFVRQVRGATYDVSRDGTRAQPLLVDVEHLHGRPTLSVRLDDQPVFSQVLEKGRYDLEVPMPAVSTARVSRYEVRCDDRVIAHGEVTRGPHALVTPADYVDTMMGAGHSRWMIAPGPWMPFGMVKLSPDNQNPGFQGGYQPSIENIGTFSHIHEWTMSGLGVFPTRGPLQTKMGDEARPEDGYRSTIDKTTEEAPLGCYKVRLTDYDILAELTATTRCGFQRYTFPAVTDARVMVDLRLPAEYNYNLEELELRKVSDYRLEGFSRQVTPEAWAKTPSQQDYTVHFVLEFDQPIKRFGTWLNDQVGDAPLLQAKSARNAGAYVEFDTREHRAVQVRSGISLVSVANASDNLRQEIAGPFGWNFEAVRNHQRTTWNELLERVKITSDDRREKRRFYTNLYRSLCSRNTWSDANGQWVDAEEKTRQLKDPRDVILGCDAFWNTFWNLNQLWNLVTPEWSSRWVKSQLAMYDAHGWLAKGPAGVEYIPVMVAEHEIPLIVGAYQMGIRDFDAEKAFAASKKMQTQPAHEVGGGLAGNVDLPAYLKYGYVPYDLGRFSNTMEFAYDDWTIAQFAAALGRTKEHAEFMERSTWWRHALDPESGYARMRKSDGTWLPNFDPFKSGANTEYVEGNAWQLTFFVPQDVPGMIETIGAQRFLERLEWGFGESQKWRFNSPNDRYWDYPVTQGNQQSMHFAFLFNWAGRPWLTQKWSRAILDRYYGDGVNNAYLGDEDQGQMSAWFVMAALGLFQTDGGCRVDPIYEIGSPLFSKATLDLGGRYGRGKTFTIETRDASRLNIYIQSATLNGQPLNRWWLPHTDLLKGGHLVLTMGPQPNREWAAPGQSPPRPR